MTNISDGIKEIGSAEANLDADAAKERIDAHDVTKEELDTHSSSVEVANSDILKKIGEVKDLIGKIEGDSAETEAIIYQAISEVCGGDPAKMEWLAGELGIDLSKLEKTGTDLFGKDDLAALAREVAPEPIYAKISDIARGSGLDAYYPGINWRTNKIDGEGQTPADRLREAVLLIGDLEEKLAAEKAGLAGYSEDDPYRGEVEGKIRLLESTLTKIRELKTQLETAAATPDADTEVAPDAAETAETEKTNVYAVLGKVLGVPSNKPDDIKADLIDALSKADNVSQFLDELMAGLKSVKGIPGLTDSSAQSLITRTGLDAVVTSLKTEFGTRKLTAEEAEKVATLLMEGAAKIEALESAKPFELTQLSDDQLKTRATNVASFMSESTTEKLEASKVEAALKLALEKGIEGQDMAALDKLGDILGFSVDASKPADAIKLLKENRTEIDRRIKVLSQAVDGKTQTEIQAAAAEANRKNVDALLSAAAKEFPEHVGTQRWHNWVRKLANGETQKSFAEYLAEDEPVQGLEAIFLMIKKFIMQFKDLMAGINGKETLGQKLQEEIDKAKEVITNAQYERLATRLQVSVEDLKANPEGVKLYTDNEELFKSFPNLNIKEMNVDNEGAITPVDKIKFLQSLNEQEREHFIALLNSVEERPYMKNVLEAGLMMQTVDKIYDFKANMGDKLKDIKFEDRKLVVNGQSVELKAGNDLVIQEFLSVFEKDDDGTVTTETVEAVSANARAVEELVAVGNFDPALKMEDFPEDLHENAGMRKALKTFAGVVDTPITKDDLAIIESKSETFSGYKFSKDISFWNTWGGYIKEDAPGDTSWTDFDKSKDTAFKVDKWGADYAFQNKRTFINWLKNQ